MLQNDSFFVYQELSSNTFNDEESIIKNMFTFTSKEDEPSEKLSNDLYFISNTKPSNIPEWSNFNSTQNIEIQNPFMIMDDFDYAYNRIFNDKNNGNKEEEHFIEKDEENKFEENPIFDNNSINTNIYNDIDISMTEDDYIIKSPNNDLKVKKYDIEFDPEGTIGCFCKKPEYMDYKNDNISKKLKRGKRGPYKKKKKPVIKTKTNDRCFPFITGEGLLSQIKIKERFNNYETSDESSKINSENKLQLYMNSKFVINKFFIDDEGNKKKMKKKRKYKSDDIRKKIKVRFHKVLKNKINESLKNAGSTELFSFLPQFFISNISKKFNYQYMNSTFEEILSTDFTEFKKDSTTADIDKKQFIKNKKILEYLKNNKEISRLSGFDIIKKMKYKDILKNYFDSREFENSIEILKKEKESYEYIQEYILMAKSYVDYYTCNDDL